MKHGKRPTRRQKLLLRKYSLDPDNWLIVKDCAKGFEIINKISGKVRKLNREVD